MIVWMFVVIVVVVLVLFMLVSFVVYMGINLDCNFCQLIFVVRLNQLCQVRYLFEVYQFFVVLGGNYVEICFIYIGFKCCGFGYGDVCELGLEFQFVVQFWVCYIVCWFFV